MATADYASANALRGTDWFVWVEIAGISTGYGTVALASAYFSGRAAASQPSSVKKLLRGTPHVADQVVHLLEGRTEMSDLSFTVINDASEVDTLLATNRTSNWLFLKTTITASSSSIVYDDPDSVDGNWASEGDIYLGNETIHYTTLDTGTNTFSGLTRGYYSSTAEAHTGGDSGGSGELMTTYPTHLIGRRATVYLNYYNSVGAQLPDTDKLALPFGGYIDDWTWEDGLEAMTFRCGNGLSDLHGSVLSGKFGEWTLLMGIEVDGTPFFTLSTTLNFGGRTGYSQWREKNTLLLHQTNSDVRTAPASDEYFYVRVDDEFMLLRANRYTVSSGVLYYYAIKGRGLFGSTKARHEQGAVAREVLPLVGTDANGSMEASKSKFSAGDNICEVLLQFMLSKAGDGANHATYDVLPEGWGLGIPAARVDVTGIQALFTADEEAWAAGLAFRALLDEPITDLYEWAVKNIFAPFGLYPYVKLGDQITIGAVRPYTPLVSGTIAINVDEILELPGVQGGLAETVGLAIMRADWNPLTEKFESETNIVISSAWVGSRKNAGRYRTLEYESIGMRTFAGSTFPIGAGYDSLSEAQLTEIGRSRFFDRYGRPEPTYTVKTHITLHSTVEIGDFVTVTLANAPNAESTSRGISSEKYQVTAKQIVLDGEAHCVLTMQKPTQRRYRLWAPAANVTSWTDGTMTAAVTAAAYAVSGNDTDAFAVNDVVRIYDPNRTSRSATTIVTAVTSTTIVVDKNAAALGVTPASGWQILPADYTEAVAAQTSKYSWGVTGSASLTLGTERPQEYA